MTIFFKEKLIRKVKIASDKTETKENKLYFTRKIWDHSIITLVNN